MGTMNKRVRRTEQAGQAWSHGWSVDVGKGLTVLPPHSPKAITAHPPTAIAAQLPNRRLKRLKEVG